MSEIAELKKRIEHECEAMKQALYGFRMSVSHDIINHHYNAIGEAQNYLGELVGNSEACRIAVETYIRIIG